MKHTDTPIENHGEAVIYEIRLKGHLDHRWAAWFGGMSIMLEQNGDTLLSGPVADQAALHGLLRKVRDSGLTRLTGKSPSLINFLFICKENLK